MRRFPAQSSTDFPGDHARIDDRDGAINVMRPVRRRFPWLLHIFADECYCADMLKDALAGSGCSTIEIVKRSNTAEGFQILWRE